VSAVLTLAAAGAIALRARADEPARLGLITSDATKPLRLAGDELYTWNEGGEQVILIKGKVLLDQGVVTIRAARAVLWLDLNRHRSTGIYLVHAVAEGDVAIENGPKREKLNTAVFELASTPDPAPRPGVRTVQQAQGTDPFFRRALALRPPANGIVQTAATAPPKPASTAVTPTQQPISPPVEWPSETPPTGPAPSVPTPSPLVPVPSGPLPTRQVPGTGETVPVPPPDMPAAPGPPRMLSVAPRSAAGYSFNGFRTPSGEQVAVFSGGVIVLVRNVQNIGLLDIEADRLVVWTRSKSDQLLQELQTTGASSDQEYELFLAGNVQLRRSGGANAKDEQTLKAEQLYYDVRRHVAVAVQADLELRRPGMIQPIFVRADELYQLSTTQFEASRAQIFSSKLPSDPGLKIVVAHATIDQTTYERRGLFGQPIVNRTTGQPETVNQTIIHGENVVLQVEGVPIFYLPVVQGNANDPFGPLEALAFKQDRVFGTQVFSTFDVWNLLNRDPPPGTKWRLEADYLSRRGPALGSTFDYQGLDLFGLNGPYAGNIKLYGIHDDGKDILGGGRGEADDHPDWRGRAFWRHAEKIFDDFTLQTQLSLLSDKNFLEQYYKQEFDYDYNQETFVYLKYQRDTLAASLLVKPNIRRWVTEDEWLPRADLNLLGLSPFDVFTYNMRANAGYGQLHVTTVPPFPVPTQQFTDVKDETGRFDLNQELSLPFYLGPVKVVPYGVLDLTYYTDDLSGESNGRVYGGGGVRTSLPLSRLYPSVQSDLFNLNGMYHKIVLGGNYYIADSSDPFFMFPQLDRLNDDATDQAIRDITPRQPALNPANGIELLTNPLYNPQLYAIRRLVDNRVDTLDTIEVIQADVRQRWQTKRGYPGMEHVVDYLTLDVSASFFPHPDRDNFGKSVAFLEYDSTWNVGDRTAIVSTGWIDPFPDGARVSTIGIFLNRPDRTNFFLGFRYIDPIDSRALTAAATYIFSPKYAITASTTYDFGINQALANSLIITRIGTDLTMSVGFTYNALLNNFGFTMEIVPNVVAASRRNMGGLLGRSGLYR
jgi:hypothetical protein